MNHTLLLRLGCALLLSATLLTACEPMNIGPKGGKHGCTKTPKDSTATGGNS